MNTVAERVNGPEILARDQTTETDDHDGAAGFFAAAALSAPTGDEYFPDPAAADAPDDAPLLMTERSLMRVAIVAADVGARFAREGVDHDPVAWMLAPRRLFGGRRALDACRSRIGFSRATVLHGLGIGLDADPSAIDELLDDELLDDVAHWGGPEPIDPQPALSAAEGGGRWAR